MHIRIMKIRVYCIHVADLDKQSSLFLELALCRLTYIFIILDVTTRDAPGAFVGPTCPTTEDDTVGVHDNHRDTHDGVLPENKGTGRTYQALIVMDDAAYKRCGTVWAVTVRS
jgi:hypothetical protein